MIIRPDFGKCFMRSDKHYPRICLSLSARTMPEMLQKIEAGFKESDLLELRIDGLKKIRLEAFIPYKKGELLITNRMKEEGGAFTGSEDERVDCLLEAIEQGVEYVDLEAITSPRLLKRVKKKIASLKRETRIVLSTHYFEGTPSLKALKIRLDEGLALEADYVKIVPYAQNREDNLKIFSLLAYAQKKGVSPISFCMGEKGKLSRFMAPLLGSPWTYAAPSGDQTTAPGQMTVRETRRIYKLLIKK
jgi:3-dehydroquinate dehydratase type I